ncbi:AraC family transcriptional regulator [Desulfosporosinus sp. PR]|uniref:AraC family transcriptional regulator n=1 Tax=Candidatus Desulfosporosinus nitrosoreducens TaxID=3401928 RepID=UPI0027FB80DE|nr:AraC family transcriptional regulator [Desulfosporosinus sp. PR]MDQ7093725.1 AraC family transcriptional regulator [Desulfosporosinus sp. PR]
MNTTVIVQDILEYVDEHITDELSVDLLAARAGFSPWHFCRVFQWSVGYSVMSYVRNRRLAFAAHELSSGRRILDISCEYGFETHSGFSKAFRRHFGCSPETYRLHAHSDKPLPPSLLCTQKYLIGGIVLEPKFVVLPALKLAGFVLKTTSAAGENRKSIPAFWSAYISDGRMENLHAESFVQKHDEYGVCFPENQDSGEFEYVIAVEIKENAVVPEEYYVCELPPANYAVFSTPPCDAASFPSTIQGVWQYIFDEWLPKSGYEYAPDCVDFELYDDRCMSDTGKVCDIYIPLVKKQTHP